MADSSPNKAQAPRQTGAFGTEFISKMAVAECIDGVWQPARVVPVAPISLHPAAHVLHYASTCFEGMKAYRTPDGHTRVFRLDRHMARFGRSAKQLYLPFPGEPVVESMVREMLAECDAEMPEPPKALYLRPTLIGTEANIGAAGAPSRDALLYVLGSPVGDYFTGGAKALTIKVEEEAMRCAPGTGQTKTGGNYAAALRQVIEARENEGADQVLFCPGGDVQETGASNFFLLKDNCLLTKPLAPSFLDGVTRDSVITVAKDLGYEVREEDFTVDDIQDWIKDGEAFLSGTAAVLSGVGYLLCRGERLVVGDGSMGPHTQKLRQALTDLQFGRVEDRFGWLS